MERIILVKNSVVDKEWNNALPNPLKRKEKVVTLKDQLNNDNSPIAEGFVRVIRNGEKEVYSVHNFTTLKGKPL